MDAQVLAYLAGAMDSDGWFGLKKSTYSVRVRKDSTNPTYSERAGLKQVTPQIPHLLKESFGGNLKLREPSCNKNSKSLWTWQATDAQAATACELLLPFLLVKRRQAEVLLELRKSKEGPYKQFAYWFAVENPEWRTGEMVTATEATRIMGYTNAMMLSQAVRNGTLLALPWDHVPTEKPRYPKTLLLAYAAHAKSSDGPGRTRPVQLIAWRERLWSEIRELNKIGLHGTPIYHRTGHYKPA